MFAIPNGNLLATIGSNIRRVREGLGISLSELARRAGVSKSTLSSIESGKSNPTISTLWSISKALGVPFSSLVSEGIIIEEGGVSVVLIWSGGRTEAYLMRLRRGAVRNASPHMKGVKEFVVVAEGSALVGPKHGPKYVRELESVTFNGDVPHIYASPDSDSTLITVLRYGTR